MSITVAIQMLICLNMREQTRKCNDGVTKFTHHNRKQTISEKVCSVKLSERTDGFHFDQYQENAYH